MRKIKIISKTIGEVLAELSEDRNSKTVDTIWSALPIKSKANTWGGEVFVRINVNAGIEDCVQYVEKGDIAYWPGGDAFCIFFGDRSARAITSVFFNPVTIIGKLLVDPEIFKKVRPGNEIVIDKAE